LAIQLFVWAVELALADDDDDKEKKTGAKGNSEPRFIPFPLTTKLHPPEPYSVRSPEWLEFVRISRDKKLQRVIRGLPLLSAARIPPSADMMVRKH
jgi:hypothetical protein